MAEIAVAGAIAVVRQAVKLFGDLAIKEGSRLFNLKEDMEWIEREMGYIQAYLKHVDTIGSQNGSTVESLVKDIRALAYDLEDIVETYSPQIAAKEKTGSWIWNAATGFIRRGYAARSFVEEIEGIKRRIQDIPRVRETYGAVDGHSNNRAESADIWEKRKHFLHLSDPKIVGFEKHVSHLVTKLLDAESELPIISIVGMPGLGKTTLAKKVYKSVQRHFDCSAMVYVSQAPNVKQLLQDVAKQVGLKKDQVEENMEVNLLAYLQDKRYLILLDDLWDTNAWDDLKICIPNNQNRSRIVVTSRITEVASYVGTVSSLYELRPLDETDSWNLFSVMTMEPLGITKGTNEYDQLESLGRQTVTKCGGVPLSIVVISGILLGKEKREIEWKRVLEGMGEDVNGTCSRLLALSFRDLPVELKPCFLYFGLFPEDYEIFASEIINLWVAEGFVQAKGKHEPEDVGEEFLNMLISRNVIQVSRRRYDGRIRTCRIHDLLHGFCINVATECNFYNTCKYVAANHNVTRARRITISGGLSEYCSHIPKSTKVRSLLHFNDATDSSCGEEEMNMLLEGSRRLRVLSVGNLSHLIYFKCYIPRRIGNLSHLKYFKCNFAVISIPSAIMSLRNLVTLDLRDSRIVSFPKELWKMNQLRHILLQKAHTGFPGEWYSLRNIEDKYYKMEVSLPNLQTLYVVDSNAINAEWLRKFTNLRKLGISNPSDSVFHVLSDVTPMSNKLENLCLYEMCPIGTCAIQTSTIDLSRFVSLSKLHLEIPMNKLPEHTQLPPNLIKMTLKNTQLEEDPMVTLKKLPKLKILKLDSSFYCGEEMVCSGGYDSFPQLEELEIIENRYKLRLEPNVMPRIKTLKCTGFLSLGIPERMKEITWIPPRESYRRVRL